MNTYEHIPVLLNEVLEYLDPRPGQNFIDATLGGGGYSKAILERIKPDGKILAIDLDADSIENFKTLTLTLRLRQGFGGQAALSQRERVQIVQGNFARIDKIAEHHKFFNISGIVADLGLSSYELEHRGISFQQNQSLDMRFDQKGQSIDARFILNNYDEKRLEKVFSEYGEEKFSRKIAGKVLGERVKGKVITNTEDLYVLIREALPKPIKHKADDSARRIFQALRIEVNHELENLKNFLPKAFDLLNPGGRLAVVSFHSLEDRIVKQFFVGLSKGCVCPPEFPQCLCGRNPRAKILSKKPVIPSARELTANPRSKPAKLRAVEKI